MRMGMAVHLINAKVKVCPTCRGKGKVSFLVTVPPFTSTCSTCKGSGRNNQGLMNTVCHAKDRGVVEGVKEVKVTIPAGLGVDTEDTRYVPEAGNIRQQGSGPGNLFIIIKVADDPVFARDGADVYVNSNIRFAQVHLWCAKYLLHLIVFHLAFFGAMADIGGSREGQCSVGIHPGVVQGRWWPRMAVKDCELGCEWGDV
ncbi:hypothetical protein DITRI_Ditri03aG0169300 [Diplodiscus trichospermus]